MSTFLEIFIVILAAGAAGGYLNAVVSAAASSVNSVPTSAWPPGSWYSVFVGMVAAFFWWAINSGMKGYVLIGATSIGAAGPTLLLSELAQALIAALLGTQYLQFVKDQIGKGLLRSAAVTAARGQPDAGIAGQMELARTPQEVLNLAASLEK